MRKSLRSRPIALTALIALVVAMLTSIPVSAASAADTDLARNGTTTASLSQNDQDGSFPAANATDGDDSTRWASGNGPDDGNATFTASLTSDLHAPATLSGITLRWEAAYAVSYTVSTALSDPDNPASWTTAYSTTTGDGGTDDITFAAPAHAQYLRVDMTQRTAFTWDPNQLHYYGYSVYTLNVLGSYDVPQVGFGSTALSVPAGQDVTLPVTLSGAASSDQTVRVRTGDGSATAGTDYTAVDQTLTFTAGETTQNVVIPTVSQGALAGNRTFTVSLSDASAGIALSSNATATVTLTPTGAAADAGSSTVIEGFEQGVPSTYAVWGDPAGAVPVLSTATDATRPGAAGDNHVLVATVGATPNYDGFTYESRANNVSATFDWSAYDGFSFWYLGQGTGKTLAFELHNRDTSDRELGFEKKVVDDTVGWRKISVLFKDLTPKSGVTGVFNPATSTGFAVTLSGMGTGTFTFDDFSLDKRVVLLDNFENGITGDADAKTGYFPWFSQGATVTIGTAAQERGDVADNHVLTGQYQIPTGGYGGFSDNLTSPQDWSSFRGIRFWWYASQANNPASPSAGPDIQFEIKDGGPDAEHAENWTATFKDNWSTDGSRWKLVSIPFSAFTPSTNQPGSAETQNGTLDLTSMRGYSFTFPAGSAAPVNWAIDDIGLYGTPAVVGQLTVTTDEDVYLVNPGDTANVAVAVVSPTGSELTSPVTVTWRTGGGTAVDGTDFTVATGTLTFPAGTPSGTPQTIEVPTTAGTVPGAALTIPVTLTSSAVVPTSMPRVVINAHGLPYLDASLPINDRVNDLMSRMSLQEKAGQMAQAERLGLSSPQQIAQLGLGSILSGGGSVPAGNTPDAWAAMIDDYQRQALSTPWQIPLLYGVDAVHGHSNVKDATIYPHNIGLGATRNPELVGQIAEQTAIETKTTGANWAFAPCVCVSRDERWGRSYESFGEDPALVSSFVKDTVEGLQGDNPSDITGPDEVLASVKHWAGDGGTTYDSSVVGTGQYPIDQGITNVSSLDLFERLYVSPYVPAAQAGAGTIMPSYSAISINGSTPVRMTEWPQNQALLKDTIGFNGFLISDWQAIDKLSGGTFPEKVVRALNDGSIDMGMVPYNFPDFITAVVNGVNGGQIPQSRVDDAVRRILTEKFDMGLFQNAFTDASLRGQFGSAEHRATAAQAAAQSQVLLQNSGNALPLHKTGSLYVAGSNADDLGNQMGGWTISWQGGSGNGMTTGTTILQGIKNAAPGLQVTYSKDASADTAGYDTGLVVVGETPYAEGQGDVGNNGHTLELSAADKAAVDKVCSTVPTCVVLVISGRPLMLGSIAGEADAIVAGFLPGSEGEGVASVLLGDSPFTGRLPVTWPASATQVPINVGDASYAPAWAYGWGLRTDSARSRLTTLVGQLDGDAKTKVQALLDANVWAPDGSLSDLQAGLQLVAAAAQSLTQNSNVDPVGPSVQDALAHPIDPTKLSQAGVVVSVARDAAQAAIVAEGSTANAEHVKASADAEHLQESGDAYGATVALSGIAGVTIGSGGTAPVVTAATTPATPDGTAGWFVGPTTLTLTATDDQDPAPSIEWKIGDGAWTAYTGPITVPEGTTTYDYRATDNEGNVATNSITVKRDATAPTATATYDDHGGTTTDPVEVTLTGSDSAGGSGVASLSYSIDGGSWTDYSAPFQVTGAGQHTVTYKAVDVAGNSSEPQTATITIAAPDTTAPTVTATTDPASPSGSNGWFKTAAKLVLSATDAGSGVASIEYSTDGTTWTAYTAPVDVPEGTTNYSYRATDHAGNTSTPGSTTIKVDTTAPAAAAQFDDHNGTGTAPVAVTLTATDAGSGVATIQYSLDGGSWTTYTTPVQVTGGGTHTLAYTATDQAGNTSATQTATIRIANPPSNASPVLTITQTPEAPNGTNGWYIGTAPTIAVQATSPSGIASVQYRIGGGQWTPYTAALTAPAGSTDYQFRATGTNGKTTTSSKVTLKYDNTNPVTAASYNDRGGSTLGPIAVKLTSKDTLSGVSGISYSIDGGAWTTAAAVNTTLSVSGAGAHTVAYYSTDKAGNNEAVQSATVTIAGADTTAPDLTVATDPTVPGEQTSGVAGIWMGQARTTVAPIGSTTYSFRATDKNGNVSAVKTVTIKRDPTPPTVAASYNNGTTGPIPVTLTATDATSGVASIQYSLDGGAWTTYTDPVQVSSSGKHT